MGGQAAKAVREVQAEGYRYFAFISYKREDEKWARWLKRSLQSYRLPNKTHQRHRNLPLYCKPVFMDKTNLTPGPLDDGLKEEVQSAKYLIVICSRQAHDRSVNLDKEISFFLEGGGTPERVIPFIVDDSRQPEKDCFPSALQALCEEKTIVGANIFDAGRRRAFLKVVASMHGLSLTEMVSDDVRRRTVRSALAAFAILAALGGALAAWDYFRVKTAYYLDYTERYGVPEGIHALQKEELAVVGNHYVLVSQKGKVRELRYENAQGQLTSHIYFEAVDAPIFNQYEYVEATGKLERVVCRNLNGETVRIEEYTRENVIDLSADDAFANAAYTLSNMESSLLFLYSTREDLLGSKSNIVRYLVEYDDNGFLREKRYVSDKSQNLAATDADGISGLRFERDEKGRVTKCYYLTYTGSDLDATNAAAYAPLGNKAGQYGCAYEYDADDNHQSILYFGKNEEPYYQESTGFCAMDSRYDAQHHQTEVYGLGSDGKPVIGNYGYASYICTYNASGAVETMRLLGLSGEPVFCTDGYASVTYEYDENGNMIQGSYFGLEDEPVFITEGFWREAFEYQDGRIVRVRYYGTDGNPTVAKNQYASAAYTYNAEGKTEEIAYFGADGLPTLVNGYASQKITYYTEGRNKGREASRSYFGLQGQPVLCAMGYAAVEYGYDKLGNLSSARFLDTNGDPVIITEGYAGYTCIYNEQGLLEKQSVLGIKGELLLSPQGCASYTYDYDAQGRIVRLSYLGVKDEPVMISSGYASCVYAYDERGREISAAYYDTDDCLTINTLGFAVSETAYDERGRVARLSYFGVSGEAVLCAEGFHAVSITCDERGNAVCERYWGTDDKPILMDGEYAGIETAYDALGRVTQHRTFDADEKTLCVLSFDENGTMIREAFYDDQGNEEIVSRFDDQGKKTSMGLYSPEGQVMQLLEYDGDEKMSRATFFNGFGSPETEKEYDAQGNMIKQTEYHYDENGVLALNDSGYAVREVLFSETHHIRQMRYLDAEKKVTKEIFSDDGSSISAISLYGENGVISQTTAFGPEGNKTETRYYSPEGKLDQVIEYNAEETIVRRTYYDGEGNMYLEIQYDDAGQETERTEYLSP